MLIDVYKLGQRDWIVDRAGKYLGAVTHFPYAAVQFYAATGDAQRFASLESAICALVRSRTGAADTIKFFWH